MKKRETTNDDAFFAELQTIWDSHSRRVEKIVRESESRRPLNYCYADRRQSRETVVDILMALGMFLAAGRWACLMGPNATDSPSLILFLIAEVILVLVGLYCCLLAAGSTSWLRRFALPWLGTPHMAVIVVAVMLAVPFLSHGSVGDGLTVTQNYTLVPNHTERMASMQTVTNILNA